MGRVKLDIKKLENSSGRQATYSKRKHGILKKAEELSVLCDIDLVLVMFSPGGKPSFRCGQRSGIEEVIAKYNQLPPQERVKKKLEGLEALKKTYKKKSDHDVNIQDFITSTPTVKELTDQAGSIQTRIAEVHDRLRYWTNPDKISDLELVMQMEDSLQKSLDQIQGAKENIQKRRCLSVETCTELPFHVSGDQQLQRLLWTPSDMQSVVMTSEPNLSTPREMESCTGSTSGSYFGGLSACSKSEANSPGQLSGIDNISQDAIQGLQFGGQYPYLPYTLNMQSDTNLSTMLVMDQQQSTPAYDVGGSYQPTLTWPDISSHLPPESPAESAFGYYLSYQKSIVPTPALPSIYERMTRDSSHLLFDNAPNHHA